MNASITSALKPSRRFEFSSLSLAKSFVNRAEKINMIVLGDNGLFWVMAPRHSEVLVKEAGFEYAA